MRLIKRVDAVCHGNIRVIVYGKKISGAGSASEERYFGP